jgi:rsbT co-antagonist protein RsbR
LAGSFSVARTDSEFAEIRRLLFDLTRDRFAATGAEPPGDDAGQLLARTRAVLDELAAARSAARATTARLEELTDVVSAFVSLDYTRRASATGSSVCDGLADGLNLLADELSASTVSKKYVHDILESMTDPLLVLSDDGAIRSANEAMCRLVGHAREELLRCPFERIFEGVSAAVLIGSGGVRELSMTCRTRAGAEIPVAFSASLMRDARGVLEGIVCVARDLTESQRLEQERWQIHEAMQRQAILVDELSTPLIPITDRIVIVPLIGTLDEHRTRQLTETLLHGVTSRGARVAIIDITGVRTMSHPAIQGILDAMQGLRLLGAEVVLTGVRPETATTLMDLGVDLRGLITFGTLERGIAYARSHLAQ